MACNNALIGGSNNPFSATTYGTYSGGAMMNEGFNAPVDQMGGCSHTQYKFVCQCTDRFTLTNNPNFDCSNPNSSYDPTGWGDCMSDGIYDLQKGTSDTNVNGCCGTINMTGSGCNCGNTYYQNGFVAGQFHPPTNECDPSCPVNIHSTQTSPFYQGGKQNTSPPPIIKSDPEPPSEQRDSYRCSSILPGGCSTPIPPFPAPSQNGVRQTLRKLSPTTDYSALFGVGFIVLMIYLISRK